MVIEWSKEALDAAARAANGRGYLRYSLTQKERIREEMRAILNAAVHAQGCVLAPPEVIEVLEKETVKSSQPDLTLT